MSLHPCDSSYKDQLISEALNLLKQMDSTGVSINFISYNTVLDLYVRLGRTNQAVDFLVKVLE